jgi:membrane fusion protein (multidrug efflux system)
VTAVTVDEGQKVRQGQALATLDDREIQAALEQIRVQLAEKKVRQELALLEADASEYRERQAQTELSRTESDLGRLVQLDPELVSPKDLDDTRYAVSTARDALKVAQFNTRKARLDVGVAEQAVKQLEARGTEVEIQAREHQILAPLAGVVSRRLIKGGEAINAATELFEVVDNAHLVSYLDRPQRELAMVEQARQVSFTTDAYPGRTFTADVDLIGPVVDRATGTFKIRIKVRQDDSAVLRPGLFIKASILTEENRDAIMVPKTAIIADGEDSVVFYVREPLGDKGKVRRLRLELGIEDDTAIEVRNRGARSLRAGDLIVVSGHQDLKDQAEVQLSTN